MYFEVLNKFLFKSKYKYNLCVHRVYLLSILSIARSRRSCTRYLFDIQSHDARLKSQHNSVLCNIYITEVLLKLSDMPVDC